MARKTSSASAPDETRRRVAYIGWFTIRGRALPEQRKRRGALWREIDKGGRWTVVRRRRVWTKYTPREMEELRREMDGTDLWIGALTREMRENAAIAGDLIPEPDRERGGRQGAA
jgi:hypothetical protein